MPIAKPQDRASETVQDEVASFDRLLKSINQSTPTHVLCDLEDFIASEDFQRIFETYQNFPNEITEELERITTLPNLYGDLRFQLQHLKLKQGLADKRNCQKKGGLQRLVDPSQKITEDIRAEIEGIQAIERFPTTKEKPKAPKVISSEPLFTNVTGVKVAAVLAFALVVGLGSKNLADKYIPKNPTQTQFVIGQ